MSWDSIRVINFFLGFSQWVYLEEPFEDLRVLALICLCTRAEHAPDKSEMRNALCWFIRVILTTFLQLYKRLMRLLKNQEKELLSNK